MTASLPQGEAQDKTDRSNHCTKEMKMSTTTLTTVVENALAIIEMRYGHGAANENELAFHGTRHTRGVVNRALALAKAMGVSDQDVELAGIAAAFHDTVQNWEEATRPSDGATIRKRFAGQNEKDSAQEAVTWMRRAGTYTESAEALVTEAILATVPGWNQEHKTVIQPNLRPDSHLVVRAVALADLGTGGMEGMSFVEEGDPLFREENLDIARAIRAATCRNDIPEKAQQGFLVRMLNWTRSQTTFASGRKALLEAELGDLDESAKGRVRALFSYFDEAIAASDALLAERQNLSFWDLAAAMGYAIPTA